MWPCEPAAIPHYEWGYDYLLQALAARGYAVAAPNLIGALSEAPAWSDPEDPQGARSLDYYRVEPLVDRLMAELAAANRGESMAFGLDLTGRLDLGQVAIVGHSRGGEWANMLAQRRQGNTGAEGIAAGRGSIGAVFLLTPSYGDFAEQEPESLAAADVPFAVVPAYCDDDLRENPLSGQAYLEGALQDGGRSSPAWVVALQTGEHYGFNPVIPFPSYNPNSVFYQDREQLLTPEDAQTFLAQLAPAFLDVAFGRLPAAAIPGFEPGQPLTTTLYGAAVEITALPQPEQRLPLLIPRDDSELATNLVGGTVEVEGALQVSLCEGTGERMCVVDRSITLRPEATPEDWVYAPPRFAGYPPQLRVQWDEPGAQLRLTIPEAAGDLSGYTMLHLRTLVDMFDERNEGVDSQSFSVALVDRAGIRAAVVLSPEEPALIKDRGERIEPHLLELLPVASALGAHPAGGFRWDRPEAGGGDGTDIRPGAGGVGIGVGCGDSGGCEKIGCGRSVKLTSGDYSVIRPADCRAAIRLGLRPYCVRIWSRRA